MTTELVKSCKIWFQGKIKNSIYFIEVPAEWSPLMAFRPNSILMNKGKTVVPSQNKQFKIRKQVKKKLCQIHFKAKIWNQAREL